MISLALIAALSLLGQQPSSLSRVFVKGEKNQYEVLSHLQIETRGKGLETWIPEDLDLSYKFTSEVEAMLPDGVAKIHYLRPTVTQIFGETYDAPAKTTVDKLNLNYELTVSPANEIINHADLGKKASKWVGGASAKQQDLGEFLGQFINELFRLSVFAGSMDNALDFAPKFPLGSVKVGDTWKRTVGYQPQKLKGKGEMAIQRIDYTYAYKGLVDSGGNKVVRVTATLAINSDLAAFANQLAQTDTGLKEFPLTLASSIDFNLDPKTLKTISANATSQGGFRIVTSESPDEPLEEMKLKGQTSFRLIGSTIVK